MIDDLTLKKWEDIYLEKKPLYDWGFIDSDRFLRQHTKGRQGLYLEAGCGLAKNALMLRDRFKVMGLDISLSALTKVKGVKVICGDVRQIPFKNNLFDVIYAGGLIEHFLDTKGAVRELYRVLAKGGLLIATVPLVSLSTLTYGQLQGNIPNVPILKNLAEFIHIRLLKKRFMRYGYEKSFTVGKIYSIFKDAGFKNIRYGAYQTRWEIKFFKSDIIKRFANLLARWRPFWPVIYVRGEKRE